MNACFLLLTLAFTQLAGAAPPPPAVPPANLPAAIERQAAAREALSAQGAEAKAALRKWYESAIDAVKKDAIGKGTSMGWWRRRPSVSASIAL